MIWSRAEVVLRLLMLLLLLLPLLLLQSGMIMQSR